MQHNQAPPPSSAPVDSVPEENPGSDAHRSQRPAPPGWTESKGYPSWLPSAPWKIDGDPDDVPGDGKHWESARKLVEDFDAATVAGWKDEVETQLLVASLLAAVTGAFTIETQKELSEDPAVTTAFVLTQIALQLNQSISIPSTTIAPFHRPSTTSRAVNSLFFASLGLSLAKITIGLLCLQWLRGLAAQPKGTSAQNFLLFRHRRDRAFQEWGAKGMILTLPLLLLASLVSLFGALLVSTSSVDWVVAIPLFIILISALNVLLFTTFAPGVAILRNALFDNTWPPEHITFPPFHSLQSWVVLQGLLKLETLLTYAFDLSRRVTLPMLHSASDWATVDQFWTDWLGSHAQRHASALSPLALSFAKKEDQDAIYHCYSDLFPSNAVTPGRRRLDVYRHIVERVPKVRGPTLLQVQDQLVHHLVCLLNSGKHLQDLGSLHVEAAMDHFFISSDAMLQFMHALIQSFGCEPPPTLCEDNWELLWNLAMQCLNHGDEPDLCHPWIMPPLFNDMFDLVGRYLEDHHVEIVGEGFSDFIRQLRFLVDQTPYYRGTVVGRKVVTTLVYHPVWPQLWQLAKEINISAETCMQLVSKRVADFPNDEPGPAVGESGLQTVSPPLICEPKLGERQSHHTGPLHPQKPSPSRSPSDSPYTPADHPTEDPAGPSSLHETRPDSPAHRDDDDNYKEASPTPFARPSFPADESLTEKPQPSDFLPSLSPTTLHFDPLLVNVGQRTLSGTPTIDDSAKEIQEEQSQPPLPPPHSFLDEHQSVDQEWITCLNPTSGQPATD